MSTNLHQAANNWSNRPGDERFASLAELYAHLDTRTVNAREATVQTKDLAVVASGREVLLTGKEGKPAHLTHYAFGQLSQLAGAPAQYLRTLPSSLAAEALAYGLDKLDGSDERSLLLDRTDDDGLTARAMVSTGYSRVWDSKVVKDLVMPLESRGWRVPPARPAREGQAGTRQATEEDVLRFTGHSGLSPKVGDLIAPAGLYASDRDMFIFMVDDSKRIDVRGASLARGFFLWNSEVGSKSLGVTAFLFDSVCGNHIVWDVKGSLTVRFRHTGGLERRWGYELSRSLSSYAEMGTAETVRQIEAAQAHQIAPTKEDVIEVIGTDKRFGLTQTEVEEAYDTAEATPRYGSPRSAWGIAQGLTQNSQRKGNAEDRVRLDRAASTVIHVAF